jgi:hypothetical protein
MFTKEIITSSGNGEMDPSNKKKHLLLEDKEKT